jgi:hypothetical protein
MFDHVPEKKPKGILFHHVIIDTAMPFRRDEKISCGLLQEYPESAAFEKDFERRRNDIQLLSETGKFLFKSCVCFSVMRF